MENKYKNFREEKIIRYGIRKYSFGVASVAILVGLMFGGSEMVSASQFHPKNDSVIDVKVSDDVNNKSENQSLIEKNVSPVVDTNEKQVTDTTTQTPC